MACFRPVSGNKVEIGGGDIGDLPGVVVRTGDQDFAGAFVFGAPFSAFDALDPGRVDITGPCPPAPCRSCPKAADQGPGRVVWDGTGSRLGPVANVGNGLAGGHASCQLITS